MGWWHLGRENSPPGKPSVPRWSPWLGPWGPTGGIPKPMFPGNRGGANAGTSTRAAYSTVRWCPATFYQGAKGKKNKRNPKCVDDG